MKRLYLPLKIIFLILIYIAVALPAKSKVLELSETKDTYKLGKYLHILEDKKGELTFDDILKKNHAQKYITVNKDAPNMGFTFSTFWIKFTLSNQSQKNLYLFPRTESSLFRQLAPVPAVFVQSTSISSHCSPTALFICRPSLTLLLEIGH